MFCGWLLPKIVSSSHFLTWVVRLMVFVADKLTDTVLLWEKNIVPWLINAGWNQQTNMLRMTGVDFFFFWINTLDLGCRSSALVLNRYSHRSIRGRTTHRPPGTFCLFGAFGVDVPAELSRQQARHQVQAINCTDGFLQKYSTLKLSPEFVANTLPSISAHIPLYLVTFAFLNRSRHPNLEFVL